MKIESRLLALIVCTGSPLLYIPVQALPADISGPAVAPYPATQLPKQVQPDLRQVAKAITVKVLSGDTWGSGILIQKQGQIYTVLTNRHVLTPGEGQRYRIQTGDGRIYLANLVNTVSFEGNDLGLLQFRSRRKVYAIASLETSSNPAVGEEVFAAGFPIEATGFFFNVGQISLVLDRGFVGGYQIAYTNDIQKGMSGGPLLNRKGKVVGINGMHSYPLWGNPYVFKDGSTPSLSEQQEMIRFSWAVPVQTFLPLLPRISTRISPEMPTRSQPVIVDPKLPRILHNPELLW